MSNLFITGATGFIGNHLVKSLSISTNHNIRILSRQSHGHSFSPSIEVIQGTLQSDLKDTLKSTDVVIHLASAGVLSSHNGHKICFETNLSDSLNFILKAVDAGVRKFIVIGSGFEFGRQNEYFEKTPPTSQLQPLTPYACSKAALSALLPHIASSYKLSICLLRPFYVYGEGEHPKRFWPALVSSAQSGCDFNMSAGQQIIDIQHVSQVISQIIAEIPMLGEYTFCWKNLGSGNIMTLRDFAKEMWEHYGGTGRLIIGSVPYRSYDLMRYVPSCIPFIIE